MGIWCDIKQRIPALLLVGALCAVMLVGCHGDGDPDAAMDTNTEILGQIYDTGELRALVPDGWAAFPIPDVFADEPDAVKTSCFHIIKGGVSERDIHAKPYIRLECLEPGVQTADPDPALDKNVEDVGPLDLGGYSWNGYVCEDCFGGYGKPVIGKMAVLYREDGSTLYEAVIRLEFNGQKEKISLEDRNVQAILASVQFSE